MIYIKNDLRLCEQHQRDSPKLLKRIKQGKVEYRYPDIVLINSFISFPSCFSSADCLSVCLSI